MCLLLTLDITSLYRVRYFRYSNLPFIMAISGCWNVWYLCFWWLGPIKCSVFQRQCQGRWIEQNDALAARADVCLCGSFVAPTSFLVIQTYVFIFFFIQNLIHTPCCERNVIRVSYYSIKLKNVFFLCHSVCHW